MKERRNRKVPAECRAARPLLCDYAGPGDNLDRIERQLVRKHLAGCPDCRKAAADFSAVIRLLHSASKTIKETPAHLSPDRRNHIIKLCGEAGR